MTPNTKHTSIEPDEPKSQPRMGWVSGFLIMLGLLKFGIPIILQDQVEAPSGILEWIFLPWPMQYGTLLLVLWALWAITQWPHRTRHRSIFLLVPMGWFTLQLASTWGIDRELSWMMVGHFLTLLTLFYSGFFLLEPRQGFVIHLPRAWSGARPVPLDRHRAAPGRIGSDPPDDLQSTLLARNLS